MWQIYQMPFAEHLKTAFIAFTDAEHIRSGSRRIGDLPGSGRCGAYIGGVCHEPKTMLLCH